MPQWSEQTNRINCTLVQTMREVYCNNEDTGLQVSRPLDQWSIYGTSRGRIWQRTPGFLALKKSGQLPDNSLNYESTVHTCGPMVTVIQGSNSTCNGNWDVKSYYYKNVYSHTYPSPPRQYTDLDVTKLVAQAKLAAINKAKSNQFNAPVFVAEATKTSEMVLMRAKQLANIMMSLKRGDIGSAIGQLHPQFIQRVTVRRRKRIIRRYNRQRFQNPQQAAANTWLELQYGWIPFISEVRSAVNTLMDVVDVPSNRNIRTVTSGKASARKTFREENGGSFILYNTINDSQEVSVRCVWRARAKSADLPGRFGMINPFEVAWELLPLSFVIDWFVPIGDYLAALDAPMRYEHLGGTVGIKQQLNRTLEVSAGPGYTFASGRASSERVLVSVDQISSFPLPGVTDVMLAPNLSATRVASGLALLRQAFR